jgi:hypothetical protein
VAYDSSPAAGWANSNVLGGLALMMGVGSAWQKAGRRQRKLLVQFKYDNWCKHVAWLLGLITCGQRDAASGLMLQQGVGACQVAAPHCQS